MTMRTVVSLAAMLGLLGLAPQPGAAKSCEEFLAGNGYSCTTVSEAPPRADDTPEEVCVYFAADAPATDPDKIRATEDDGEVFLTIDGAPGDPSLCACGPKGRITNPKFGEGADVTCVDTGGDGTVFMGKATKKGLKKGFVFNGTHGTDVLFECALAPECVPPPTPCGLERDTCGGECPDGTVCLNTGPRASTCECVATDRMCEAATVCDDAGLCPGTSERCTADPDTGDCGCEPLIAE